MNLHKAFSLIEISIVLLIIGILVAGATQGSRLIDSSRLQSAQTLTQSSPVAGIKGLVLWLEPSMEDSFLTTETDSGSQVSRWNDRNPQAVRKYYALKTASSAVTYVSRSPSTSLPSLYFDGSTIANSFFTLSTSSSSAVNTFIPTPNCAVSYFLVADQTSSTNTDTRFIISNSTLTSTNGFGYYFGGAAIARSLVYITVNTRYATTPAVTLNKPEIISHTYGGSGSIPNFYINGTTSTMNASTSLTCAAPSGAALFYIGNGRNATNTWSGHIYEIIYFDRLLKNEERKEIEKYLGQKYRIAVS